MQKLSCNNLFVLFVAFLLISPISVVQATIAPTSNEPSELKPLNIPYHNGDITVDGELDEDLWSKALQVDLNIVNSPWNNLPSPVKTTAKLIENGEFLYVSIVAFDPEPEKIQGFLTDRDNAWGHDIVGFKLDTHNNRRLNYEFFVNPYGVQNDATFNEITGEANTSWDGLWYSFGKKTKQGYQVEIAVPYNILNFKSDGQEKKWAIELVRSYPRDTKLRISHVPLNRDNPCWLCQYPEAVGFENAKTGQSLRLTPSLTATRNELRDIYADSKDISSDWATKDDVEAGIDLRWAINANNLFNATINPDFSTVESDSGQLNVNTNFSLFYEEKRAFFLDNSDYFSSDFNLIYTRNIAAPDYGAKLTGRVDKHSYGVFTTNDTKTNILLPGNLNSGVVTLNKESNSSALRYRYDYDEDLTIGTIATLRSADDYHNYVVGFDARYRLSDSNAIKAQVLNSDTLYSEDIIPAPMELAKSVELNNDSFSDQAFKLNFIHDSEYWLVDIDHQNIGADFRADLGFMPKADIKTDTVFVRRSFYAEQDSLWQEAGVSGKWQIVHNTNNELIERELVAGFIIDGPLQSEFELAYVHGERVGLRHDDTITDIDGNTTMFNEDQVRLFTNATLNNRTYASLSMAVGDKIDYSSNRLGSLIEATGNITVFITDHLEFDFYQTYSKLDAKEDGKDVNVYLANISELRLSYQFDVRSYLKLSVVYHDIEYTDSEQYKDLSTQLIYAYKINPQTVFFLGYSDYSQQDYDLTKLKAKERTFFTKVSYAWAP
jgi:hypothetical protein